MVFDEPKQMRPISSPASTVSPNFVVQMMRPQKAAYSIMRGLGFKEEHILKDYVRDLVGRKQDLIVMRCELAELWCEMESYLSELDWQRHR